MNTEYTSDCPLCQLVSDGEVKTRLLLKNSLITIVDCLVCQVPMAVLNRHHSDFKSEQRQEIRKVFIAILNDQLNPLPASVDPYRLYGGEVLAERPEAVPWVIDWEQRKILDHAHCHLRPSAFPNTSHWELI